MLDLDFAFFNLIDQTKTGLAYKKVFLDRLTPLFFAPRLEKLIDMPYLDARGGNILLPLGVGNLNILQQERHKDIAQKTQCLLEEYNLANLAVDRRLKDIFPDIYPRQELIFGEEFIKALAHVLIKAYLSRHDLRKIIIVSAAEDFALFISSLDQYQLPVSIQNFSPHRDEIFAHQLLYEKGQAVSTSYLTPENWEEGDLVIIFADNNKLMENYKGAALTIILNNCSSSLAPELERGLAKDGLAPNLFNLAPIMESCLRAKTGFSDTDTEPIIASEKREADFRELEEIGRRWGLWDHFLDKVL